MPRPPSLPPGPPTLFPALVWALRAGGEGRTACVTHCFTTPPPLPCRLEEEITSWKPLSFHGGGEGSR